MQNKSTFCTFELQSSFTSFVFGVGIKTSSSEWHFSFYISLDISVRYPGELALMPFRAHSRRMSFIHVGTSNHTWGYKLSSVFQSTLLKAEVAPIA